MRHLLFAGMALLLATNCLVTAPQEKNLVLPESKDDSSSTTLALVAAASSAGTGASGGMISVSPASISYGLPSCNSVNNVTVTITNTGTGGLTLSPLPSISGNAAYTIGAPGATSIAAGQNTTVVVTFTASGSIVVTGTVTISSNNASNSPVQISLSGQGGC